MRKRAKKKKEAKIWLIKKQITNKNLFKEKIKSNVWMMICRDVPAKGMETRQGYQVTKLVTQPWKKSIEVVVHFTVR